MFFVNSAASKEVFMRCLILIASGLLVSVGIAQAADKTSESFLTKAIEGNFAEVEMGKLAQSNGQSQEVKSFGNMLVTDHSAANDKAMAAAKSLSVTPPTGPNAKQKADHDKMAKMKGAEFDKRFAKDMVADHKKDIAEYKKESSQQDAAGQYAKDSLPTLQKHLETAQSLEKPK
jgi:putative membrane protein